MKASEAENWHTSIRLIADKVTANVLCSLTFFLQSLSHPLPCASGPCVHQCVHHSLQQQLHLPLTRLQGAPPAAESSAAMPCGLHRFSCGGAVGGQICEKEW